MKRDSGQALLEFAICAPVAIVAVGATVLLLRTEWNRTQCAHRAFLAAHRALRPQESTIQEVRSLLNRVQIEKNETGVTARAVCGEAVETVQLPDLEHAQW
ncbi:MAG: TadE/TadG family type IV pilus assembly protein [Bdellovibrionia bacterium]